MTRRCCCLTVRPGFRLSSVNTNLVQQQTSPHGLRLVHHNLPEFHYSQLSAQVIAISSGPATTKDSSRSHVLWFIARAAGVLVVFAIIYTLSRDLRLATTELHALRQAALRDAVLSSPDGLILTETVTVTSTTTTTLSPGDPRNWWNKPGSKQHPVPTSLATDDLSSTTIPTPDDQGSQGVLTRHSPPLTTTQATERNAIQTTTPSTHSEPYSLIPAHYFSMTWSWRKFLSPKFVDAQVAQSAKEAAQAVIGGMGVVWQIFRKIIHYPLDPP